MTVSAPRCESEPSLSYARPETRSTIAYPSSVAVDEAIANWVKWLRDESGIYPRCPVNWDLIDSLPYKNGDDSTAEKLERVERQIPPDERMAERVEMWIRQFDPVPKVCLRV